MAAQTARSPQAGTRSRRPWHRPDDQRTDIEIFADPTTPESYVLNQNLLSSGRFAAVMARADKSSALLGHIIDAVVVYGQVGLPVTADMLLPLLSEPALSEQDLQGMSELAAQIGSAHRLRAGICAHARVHPRTVIDVVWQAPARVSADISAATGTLLPAATDWVKRELGRAGLGHESLWYVSADQYNKIMATVRRWESWARRNTGRWAFLSANSFAFTDEDEMFAAGAAVLAAPSHTGRS